MTADANPAQTDPPAQSPARTRSEFLARLIAGATAGVFSALLFCELTFLDRAASYVVAAGAVLLALLNLTRFWKTVWAAAAVSVVTILVIGFTPLVPWLLQDPPREAPLERCDAVVSLGAGINEDGTLAAGTQDRALHSLTLLRAGWAPRLVLTGNEAQGESIIRGQMHALGLNFPIENSGPVKDTHDESVSVARLVHARGWHQVILVTHGWHMARAAAAFEKAGVRVLRSPCPDSRCDMHHPSRLPDRIRALACLIHEAIGYRVYRMRGWV